MDVFLLIVGILIAPSIVTKSVKENNEKSSLSKDDNVSYWKEEKNFSGKIFNNKTKANQKKKI